MKTTLRNLCLLLAILGIGSLSLGVALLSRVPGTHLSADSRPVQEEKSLPGGELTALKVSSVSADVIWHDSPEGEFKAKLTGRAAGIAPTLEVTRSGEMAVVALHYRPQAAINFRPLISELTLDIYAPKKRWQSVEVGSVSGNVRLGQLEADDFRFHSVSGELESAGLTAGQASFSSTSGDLNVSGFTGEARANTVSGKIELSYAKLSGNLKARTTSGEVQVDLPEEVGFTLDAHSTSGEIKSAFPITISGGSGERHRLSGVVAGGGPLVEVETVSGNVDLF